MVSSPFAKSLSLSSLNTLDAPAPSQSCIFSSKPASRKEATDLKFCVSLILIHYLALCCRRRRAEPAGRSEIKQQTTTGMKTAMVFEAPHPGRRVTLSKSDEKLKRDEHSSEMRSHEPKPSIETKPQQKKVSRVRVRRRPSQFTVEGADFSEILAVAEEMAKECGDYENLDPNEANDMETAIK